MGDRPDLIDEDPFAEDEDEVLDELELEEDVDIEEDPIDDEISIEEPTAVAQESINRVPDTERKTYNRMTKYEKTSLVSVRAQQLANGLKPLIDSLEGFRNPIEIAKEELKQRKIPLVIHRNVRGGKFEIWKVDELIH